MTAAPRWSRPSMQFRSGTRRTAAAIGAAALGLVALSACEKPTPLATVSVGTNSVSSEAACYNDGKKLSQEELRDCIGESSAKKLTVHDGERIRVGVEPEIADSGWVMGVNGQGTMAEASKDTYRTFAFDQVFAPQQSAAGVTAPKKAQVTIVEVTKDGQARGVWQFTLNRAS